MSDRPIIDPFVVQYDEKTKKLSSYSVKNDKYLSEIAEFFYDQKAVKKILDEGNNPMIYTYHDKVQPPLQGEFNFGITILFPGTIKDEFFMTRGHFHGTDEGEFYMGLEGEGILVLENQKTRKVQTLYFTKNDLLYIPAGFGHRVVNIGKERLVFLTVEAAHGSHDYDTIKREGFGVLVLRDESSKKGYKIISNPSRKNKN